MDADEQRASAAAEAVEATEPAYAEVAESVETAEMGARATFTNIAPPPKDDPVEDGDAAENPPPPPQSPRKRGRSPPRLRLFGKTRSGDSPSAKSPQGSGGRFSTSSPDTDGSAAEPPSPTSPRRMTLRLSHMVDVNMNEEDPNAFMKDWSPVRILLHNILTHTDKRTGTIVFDTVMGVIIIGNIFIMIPETDIAASCEFDDPEACIPTWIVASDYILLTIYAIELSMRMLAYRAACFKSKWVILDMIIVGVGILGILLADIQELKRVNILRILRVARILRFIRILKRFPTLCNIIGGFVGAMQAMLWGITMILLLLVAWSLFAVEFIHPINKSIDHESSWCANAFSSVIHSTLLFFQTLVAGDSWGACAIPIIEQAPWSYLLFAGALVTVQLGFTNLVLAIIVDKAAEAREGSKEDKKAERMKQQVESFETWRGIMGDIDADRSGSISEQELMEGYAHPRVKETLDEMNISKQDLKGLFNLMDLESSGQLSYHQFLDAFFKAQVQDPKIYLMVMQLRMQKIEAQVTRNFDQKMTALTNSVNDALVAVGAKPVAGAAVTKKIEKQPLPSASKKPQRDQFVAADGRTDVEVVRGAVNGWF